MAEPSALVNVGELSRPATVLIEKISEAVGGVFAPYQLKRMAKAQAEAAIIKAQGDVELSEVQRRAIARFANEEVKKQENMEAIAREAISHLSPDAKPEDVNSDWMSHFLEECRLVSDAEMQAVWGRILAGQANAPGSYSKRALKTLSELDRADAELFTQLLRFVIVIKGTSVPFVARSQIGAICNAHGLTFGALQHLDDIGLIRFDHNASFALVDLEKKVVVESAEAILEIEFRNESGNSLPIGEVLLSTVGRQLARVVQPEPLPEPAFVDALVSYWTDYGIVCASLWQRPKVVTTSAR